MSFLARGHIWDGLCGYDGVLWALENAVGNPEWDRRHDLQARANGAKA